MGFNDAKLPLDKIVKGLLGGDGVVGGYIQDQSTIVGGVIYIDKITGQAFIPAGLASGASKSGTWLTADSYWIPYNLRLKRDNIIATYTCNHATIPNCVLNIVEFENRYEFEFLAWDGQGMGVNNTNYSITLPITLDIARPVRLFITGGNAVVPQANSLYSNSFTWRNGVTAPTPSISGWGIAFKRGAIV